MQARAVVPFLMDKNVTGGSDMILLFSLSGETDTLFKFIVAAVFAIAFAAAFAMPKGTKKEKGKDSMEDLNALFLKLNGRIDQYNAAVRAWDVQMETLAAKAGKMNDRQALEILLGLGDEYIKVTENLRMLFDKAKDILSEKHPDVPDGMEAVKEITQRLQDLYDLHGRLAEVEPEDRRQTRTGPGPGPRVETSAHTEEIQGDYFRGCKSKEEVAKRYRLLSKAYHPDSGCGDASLFLELTAQYEKKTKEFG
jgi:hypothetical protein